VRIPTPYRTVASTLVAVILLFNAGIPVTVYLCPMMSAENPTCEMSVPSFGDIPSLTKQVPSCCNKYIVAERNSTPYLKFENLLTVDHSVAIFASDQSMDTRSGWSAPPLLLDAGPPRHNLPLYLLSSSLLI
jgi:hypothetical protein